MHRLLLRAYHNCTRELQLRARAYNMLSLDKSNYLVGMQLGEGRERVCDFYLFFLFPLDFFLLFRIYQVLIMVRECGNQKGDGLLVTTALI